MTSEDSPNTECRSCSADEFLPLHSRNRFVWYTIDRCIATSRILEAALTAWPFLWDSRYRSYIHLKCSSSTFTTQDKYVMRDRASTTTTLESSARDKLLQAVLFLMLLYSNKTALAQDEASLVYLVFPFGIVSCLLCSSSSVVLTTMSKAFRTYFSAAFGFPLTTLIIHFPAVVLLVIKISPR